MRNSPAMASHVAHSAAPKTGFRASLLVLAGAAAPLDAQTPYRLDSYATVNDDASLDISGKRVYLWGVYVPRTEESCINEPRNDCRTRASSALKFKLHGFVDCLIKRELSRRELVGQCYMERSTFAEGIDLGAWLISEGWAMAGPGAPPEYRALERLATVNRKDIWGRSVIFTPWGWR